jgi:hypothetical protein
MTLNELEHGDGVSLRWTKAGARLGPSRIETGYVIYIDDGYIVAIEGHAYGEEWSSHELRTEREHEPSSENIEA